MPTVNEVRDAYPSLASATDSEVVDTIQRLKYPNTPKEKVAALLGVTLSTPNEPLQPSSVFRRVVGDTAVSLGKAAISVPETAVGLADLATGGRVGKALENEGGVGFQPKQANAFLDTLYSPEQQAANQKVQQADGFVDTAVTALQNPSAIYHGAVQSAGSLLAGAPAGRLAMGAARALPGIGERIAAAEAAPFVASPAAHRTVERAGLAAAGTGEAVATAGQNAEQVRQETPNGLLTPGQSGLIGASSVLTGAIAGVLGKVANQFGIGDVNQFIAGVRAAKPEVQKGVVRKIVEGFHVEGLQEVLQSYQEQVAQNVALGKPWDEGVGNAAAMGGLSGGLIGAGAGPFHAKAQTLKRLDDIAATHGLPSAAVDAIKAKTDGMPADAIQGFVERAVVAMDKRGLTSKPLDDLGLAMLRPPADIEAALERMHRTAAGELQHAGRDWTPSIPSGETAQIAPTQNDGRAPQIEQLPTGDATELPPGDTAGRAPAGEPASGRAPDLAPLPTGEATGVPYDALISGNQGAGPAEPPPTGGSGGVVPLQPSGGGGAGPVAEPVDGVASSGSAGQPAAARQPTLTTSPQPTTLGSKYIGRPAGTRGTNAFDIIKKPDGTVLVKGDPKEIKAALPGIPGITGLRGVTYGRTKAEAVIAKLEGETDARMPEVPRGTQQSERASSASVLPEVPRGRDAGTPEDASAGGAGARQNDRALVHEGVRQSGQVGAKAVRKVRRAEGGNTPPGLQPAAERAVAVSAVPSATSRRGEEAGVASQPVAGPGPAPAAKPTLADRRAKAAKGRAAFNPETDTLLQALAKLGGIKREVMAKEFGLKPEELKHIVSVGGLKGFPFRKNGGRDLDSALTALQDAGYFAGIPDDEVRTKFEEAVYAELGGKPTLTPQGQMAEAQKRAIDEYGADTLEQSGYADATEEVKAATQQVLDEAEKLGLDTEGLKEEAARAAGEQGDDIYHERLQEIAARAIAKARQDAARTDAAAAPGSPADRVEVAGGEGAGDAQGLTLTAPSSADLKAEADRAAAAEKADAAEQKRLADKAKADAQRGEFQLTGSNRPADIAAAAGQQDIFAKEEAKVYTVNESESNHDIPLDLFPDSLPAATGTGGNRPQRQAAKARDVQPPNTVSVREDPALPGLYHFSTQLVEVGRRDLPVAKVTNWEEAASALAAMKRFAVEHFDVLITDKAGKPLAVVGSFKGSQAQTSVYPTTILAEALRIKGAAQAWGVHNHPSGNEQLSRADEHLSGVIDRTFSPSSIKWMGLAAVGSDRFQATVASGVRAGVLLSGNTSTNVPIVERTIMPKNAGMPVANSPEAVKHIFSDELLKGKPGILFMDSQNRMTAWVPVNPEEMAVLRKNGRFDKLINSASEAGAGAAIIANPDGVIPSRTLDNIASALALADVRTLDVIDTVRGTSAAQTGTDPSSSSPILDLADNTKPDSLPLPTILHEGPVPLADRVMVARMEKVFRTQGMPDLSLTALPRVFEPANDAHAEVRKRFAAADLGQKLFGRRIVWFHSNRTFAHGMVVNEAPKVLFINENTTRPVMSVMGHELTHSMKLTNPELYAALEARIMALAKDPKAADREGLNLRRSAAGMPELNTAQLREEFVANVVGDNFDNPAFWRELAADQPSTFQKVMQAVLDWIDSVLGKLKNANVYGTGAHIRDAKAARAVVVKTMREFAQANGLAMPAGGLDIALSLAMGKPFYSELSAQIQKSAMNAGLPGAWQQAIKGMVNAGKVKADEVQWSGITDWLDLQQGKVSKQQVSEYLAANGVRVEEVTLGGDGRGISSPENELYAWAEEQREETRFVGAVLSGESPSALMQYAQADGIHGRPRELVETVLGLIDNKIDTKHSQWVLPGGTNYREVLLTLPPIEKPRELKQNERGQWAWFVGGKQFGSPYPTESAAHIGGAQEIAKLRKEQDKDNFRSGHWDQPNVLAHVRLNDRTDAEGKRVLFVEEIQSDWGQAGKKNGFKKAAPSAEDIEELKRQGWVVEATPLDPAKPSKDSTNQGFFAHQHRAILTPMVRTEQEAWRNAFEQAGNKAAVPSAPFVGKTDAWVALSLKRVIKMAVDEGYDKVAFINGDQSADRYDLSKQVNEIWWFEDPNKDGHGKLMAFGKNGSSVLNEEMQQDKIEDYIGKDAAKKLLKQYPEATSTDWKSRRELKGADLKVGGEGMKAFYDKIVPNVLKDVLKKMGWGGLTTTALRVGDQSQAHIEQDHTPTFLSDQPGFDITPAMREKAASGLPMFDLATDPPGKAIGAALTEAAGTVADAVEKVVGKGSPMAGATTRPYTPAQMGAMKNVGFYVEPQSLRDRNKAFWQDAGKKLAQGLVDQFAPVKDIDKTAYGLLRLSKGASGAFETLLKGGKLKLTDGVYDFDETQRGGFVDEWAIPLQGEHHDVLRWIAANRAEFLMPQDREHLFTKDDIAAFKTLAEQTTAFDYTIQTGVNAGMVTRDRSLIYPDAARVFSAWQKNVLDMVEQSGGLDPEARKHWENEFYVPFFRANDEGGFLGANIKGGAVRQKFIQKLKGGTDKLNSDLLENTLQNWAHLLDAAAKNRAAKATLEAAANLGIAVEADVETVRQMGRSAGLRKNTVWFMDGGRERHFLVEDPYLLTALNALEYAGMKNPVMNAMGAFKHALSVGVTLSPFYKVRNLIRDSVQAVALSGLSSNPVQNISQGWKLTDPKSDPYFRLLAGGGTINFGTMYEGSEAKRVQALVDSGVDPTTILGDGQKVKAFYRKYIEPGITAYNELGNRGEAINRASLYDQLVKQGVSHAEASLQARDLMDFSLQGSFTTIRFLTQVVPFFNARIQGLYKLGRAAKEDPAKFSAVLGATALFSLALLAAYGDDDDWKKREDWDRNNYWWFKFGGTAFRIPKPFEIGAMATLAERGAELFFDKEMTGKRFRTQVMALLGDNLSMNPVPQLVKPIIDVYSNKDSFTGRPIESMGMERLKSEFRFNEQTSMTARAASTAANAVTGLVGADAPSPVQIDHMLRGYFGWLGSFVVAAGDILARPVTGQPERPTPDFLRAATGNMASDLRDAPSRYVTQMYAQAKEIEQAYATWRELVKEGKHPEAAAFREAHAEELAKYRRIEAVKRVEARLNARQKQIERSDATPDDKRTAIREVQQQKNRAAIGLGTPS